MSSYITAQGDTWDLIAYRLWGSEYLLPCLLEANPQYRYIIIFEGGIKLNVPDVDTTSYTSRPAWLGEADKL